MVRIEKMIDENLAENQFGFQKNRGTREATFFLRSVVEKSFTVNKKVYIGFVDLLNVMMKILKMIKIDYRDRRIIIELYKQQTAFIKIKENKREAAIRKGVRQGCNLQSLLFNIHTERAINDCKEYCTGVR